MKQKDIKADGIYIGIVSNKRTTIRITTGKKVGKGFCAINMKTGRSITIPAI